MIHFPADTKHRLSDLLATFPEVDEERDGYVVPCPAHDDGRPSLRIAVDETTGNLLIHCRAGCAKEDVLEALGNPPLSGWELGDAVASTHRIDALVGTAEVAALRMYLGQAAELLRSIGPDPILGGERARAYLADRFGIDPNVAADLGLGYDPGSLTMRYLSATFSSVPRLVIPFRGFDGVARGMQGRALKPHRVRWAGPTNPDSGASWAKVAVFRLGHGLDTIVITEGPGDALSVVGAGYEAVAVRGAALGGSVASELVEGLKDRRPVIMGDNDPAGESFRQKLGDLLTEHGLTVFHAHVAPEHNDVTAWREADPSAFQEGLDAAIKEAKPHGATRVAPRPVPADDYPHTDLGNAERLKAALDLVRYSPEAGFFLWDGSCWALDRYDAVRTAAQDVVRTMATDARALLFDPATKEEGKALLTHAIKSQSTRAIDAMVKELGALRGVAVDIEDMDSRHHLLAFRNGVVNLRTGELVPHDPSQLITKRMDLDYDPEATCPRWDEFLRQVFVKHPDLIDYVQALVGYGITGETGEQCFAVLWGRGANGKSVFTDTLTHVFRPVTTTTPFSTFEAKPNGGIPNDLAAMKGARLVMAAEGERGRQMNEAVIKRLTGRDLISARFMRREFFEYRPTFLILMATNHRPTFKGQDEGLWRRVKMLPFDRFFRPHERDAFLGDKLMEEVQGIATWAVKGAVRWYAEGLKDPPSVQEQVADFRQTSDVLFGFYPGVLQDDPSNREVANDVFLAFDRWTEHEGWSERERWTHRTFYDALEERGIDRKRGAKGQYLLGVRLVDSTSEASPRGDAEDTNSALADLFKESA